MQGGRIALQGGTAALGGTAAALSGSTSALGGGTLRVSSGAALLCPQPLRLRGGQPLPQGLSLLPQPHGLCRGVVDLLLQPQPSSADTHSTRCSRTGEGRHRRRCSPSLTCIRAGTRHIPRSRVGPAGSHPINSILPARQRYYVWGCTTSGRHSVDEGCADRVYQKRARAHLHVPGDLIRRVHLHPQGQRSAARRVARIPPALKR